MEGGSTTLISVVVDSEIVWTKPLPLAVLIFHVLVHFFGATIICKGPVDIGFVFVRPPVGCFWRLQR